MHVRIEKHTLQFSFDAATSRGVMKLRDSWLIHLTHDGFTGIGEAAPIPGLSLESTEQLENALTLVTEWVQELKQPIHPSQVYGTLQQWNAYNIPSLGMALEMALLNLYERKNAVWFKGSFSEGRSRIPINGLIWMNEPEHMYAQGLEKWRQGYTCLKMKIGAADFEQELAVLHKLRMLGDKQSLMLRVDANGAFPPEDAAYMLKSLRKLDIQSIEQPVSPSAIDALQSLAAECIVPIALDESLIGVEDRDELLRFVRPQFIVLKPTLLGGFNATDAWIAAAAHTKTGWWLTSALESYYGLQALAQYLSNQEIGDVPQGLGTGNLYTNNIGPMVIAESGYLCQAASY